MKLVVHTAAPPPPRPSAPPNDGAGWVATAILAHPGGRLGFEVGSGHQVMRAMVRDVVVLERRNHPRYLTLAEGEISGSALSERFPEVVTVSRPCALVEATLAVVAQNRERAAMNELRRLHHLAAEVLEATPLDVWVGPDGLLVGPSLRWLCRGARAVVEWRSSEWGLYAVLHGLTEAQVRDPLEAAAGQLGIPRVTVASREALAPGRAGASPDPCQG